MKTRVSYSEEYTPILKNNIDYSRKRGPPPSFNSDANPALGHILPQSVFKTHVLVVTVELIWLSFLKTLSFNFVQRPNKSLMFRRFKGSFLPCCRFSQPLLKFYYFFCVMWAVQSGHVPFFAAVCHLVHLHNLFSIFVKHLLLKRC